MGYNGTFTVVDPGERYAHFERDFEELDSVVRAMGEETPRAVRDARERLADALALVEELASPPASNSFEELADALGWTPTLYGGTTPNRGCRLSLLTDKDSRVLYELVPEFLEGRTERGAELWRKLVGHGGDATYRIEIRETDYVFETDTSGFLYADELSELAEELGPILPETDAFYAEVTQRFGGRPDACRLRIIDAVTTLCEQAGSDELLIHRFSY